MIGATDMRVKTITVGFGSTINLGNYNSARLDVQYEVELDEGEDAESVTRQIHEQAREEVRRQALPIVRRNNLKLDEIVRHLPEDVQQQILALSGQEA
jgi:hypothetical protein